MKLNEKTIKLDYKKQFKDLYAPKTMPSLIDVPTMQFIMVSGKGNPNEEEGEYAKAVELLYALSYTIKMSRKHKLDEVDTPFIDYVVPPLEGLWWLDDNSYTDFSQKEKYCWISMIRQPDFITKEQYQSALFETQKKKPDLDTSKASFQQFTEGLCVQCMHIGPYDEEPATIQKIEAFMKGNNLVNDIDAVITDQSMRRHHEIYLSDPRKSNPITMQTILRHPVRYHEI